MIKKFRKELNAGTVSLMILSILEQTRAPLYGYQIVKALEKLFPQGEPAVKQGTLYPVLRSMERNLLLKSEVQPSSSGPPRKYYVITGFGREILDEWKMAWRQTRDMVDAILDEKISLDPNEGQGNE
ncbi:MAG: PadR family transcriptional regulator [Planctomycetota bacterium]